LYGYDTWSFILRTQSIEREFGNRALRRIFGPKRKEVAGGRRKLYNVELH